MERVIGMLDFLIMVIAVPVISCFFGFPLIWLMQRLVDDRRDRAFYERVNQFKAMLAERRTGDNDGK